MSTQRFNTGNPIGSNSPLDRSDNTRNLDVAANSSADTFQDRLGKNRLTWAGMENQFDANQTSLEQQFRAFIASSGYQFVGDYGPGIEITEYNQLIRDSNGEFWRVSGQVELPYVTTGAGIPEDDALVPAGDAVLRQELASQGGVDLVGRGDETLGEYLTRTDIKTTKQDLTVIAHRGFTRLAPENTIAAFNVAMSLGVTDLECDVRFTSDNVPVLFHDGTVDRVTDGTGSIESKTLSMVKALDAGSKFNSFYAGTRIATLSEFLTGTAQADKLWFEIKEGATNAQIKIAVDMIYDHRAQNRVNVNSFSVVALRYIRSLYPDLELGWLHTIDTWGEGDHYEALSELRPVAFMPPYALIVADPSTINECLSLGIETVVWDVHHTDRARTLERIGVRRMMMEDNIL